MKKLKMKPRKLQSKRGNQNKFSNKSYWIGVLLIAFFVGVSLQIVSAWTEPTDAPPMDNVLAPINEGSSLQYKTGALGVNGVFQADSDTYLAATGGEVGIGTTTPPEKLTLDGGNFSIDTPTLKEVGIITNDVGATALDGAKDVYVSGKYAYVISDNDRSLTIIDISNPSNPTEAGFIQDDSVGGTATTLFDPVSVYVSGKYAYVISNEDRGLTIIDISNPSNPTEAGFIQDDSVGGTATVLWGANSVYISGKYAYVTSDIEDSFSVINISDPSNPVEAGFIQDDSVGGTATVLSWPEAIYVSGKYAYVTAAGEDDGLTIIDISDPYNPTEEGFIQDNSAGGTATVLMDPVSVYVSGRYAYVVSEIKDSLTIIDISNPSNPTEEGFITDYGTATALSGPVSVYVSGRYAYVVSGVLDDGLTIINISNPSNLVEVNYIQDDSVGGVATALGGPASVYISGKYAYVASWGEDSLSIIDISGIDAPSASIGNISSSNITVTDNMDIGNNLYVRSGINTGPSGIKSDGIIQGSNLESLGVIKLTATTTTEACSAFGNKNNGSIYYDETLNEPCYCNGSNWTQFDGGGNCP